jgi:hypothetical protein
VRLSTNPIQDVTNEIEQERAAQDVKWGEQNHPDLSPFLVGREQTGVGDLPEPRRREFMALCARYYGLPLAERAKTYTDTEHKRGEGSWFTIHVEELAEALEAAVLGDEGALREELIQLAATATAHVQAIDRRRQSPSPRASGQGE